jgi:hypothetical protein
LLQHAEHGVTILLVRQRLVGNGLTHESGIGNMPLLRHRRRAPQHRRHDQGHHSGSDAHKHLSGH